MSPVKKSRKTKGKKTNRAFTIYAARGSLYYSKQATRKPQETKKSHKLYIQKRLEPAKVHPPPKMKKRSHLSYWPDSFQNCFKIEKIFKHPPKWLKRKRLTVPRLEEKLWRNQK